MSATILVLCPGLLAYWLVRALLLLHGSPDEIEETLENDLWLGRRLLRDLRTIFIPPEMLAGVYKLGTRPMPPALGRAIYSAPYPLEE